MDEEALRQKLKTSIGLSNEILSDEEEYVALKLLRESYDRVAFLDSEIARIHPTPQHLTARRATETEWIKNLRVGLSGQKKIPAEVLGLIFEICFADEINGFEIPPHPLSLSLVLSHVCSRWRQVALAETSLWSTLLINRSREVLPDVLEEILSRAGHAITLDLTAENIPPAILRILREHSNRFLRLDFTYNFFKNLEIPFERLETLRVLLLTLMGKKTYLEPLLLNNMVSAFAHATNVQRLRVQTEGGWVDLDLGTPSVPFPWFHLQHLEIFCEMSLTGFVHLISQCTQLISCEASLSRERDIRSSLGETPPGVVTLASLKSLKLNAFDVKFNKVLDALMVPSLQVLKLESSSTELDTLLRFFQRSGCSIHTLHIGLTRDSTLDVEELMKAIPTAVELNLREPSTLSESIVDSLCTGILLPSIEVLICWAVSCRSIKKLSSNRCEPKPDSSLKVMRKLAVCVWSLNETDEWREYKASLSIGGIVQVMLVQTVTL